MIKERDENRPIRIADIAEELGVSTATVSNVIHGKTAKVSEATIAKVQETLEKRGYIPNMAGILLAQNSSKIIGVFVNDHEKYEGHTLEDAFIASSLNHLSDEIERNGFFMMVKKAKTADDHQVCFDVEHGRDCHHRLLPPGLLLPSQPHAHPVRNI